MYLWILSGHRVQHLPVSQEQGEVMRSNCPVCGWPKRKCWCPS